MRAWVTAGAIAAVFLAGRLPATSQTPPTPAFLSEEMNGQSFSFRVGDRFAASIRDPAPGGYNVVTPLFDPAVLRVVSRRKAAPGPGSFPRLGAAERIVHEMEVVGSGETRLIVRIARDWEVGVAPHDALSVSIVAGR